MATTLNIRRFIRSVRQGRTPEPVSCTAMPACTQQAFDALLAASWTRVEERESGLPRHNWAQSGFSNNWDASKYCGDYANGYQHGYATAVCYTFRMPAEALTGTVANIASVAIPILGDRWLDDGCDILAYLSTSVTPPVWGATATDSLTGQLEVVPSNTGTDSSTILTFDWSSSPKATLAYLHIIVKLTNYLTHRGAWIEGGAMIDGVNTLFTFDRDVVEDTLTDFNDPDPAITYVDIPFGFPDMPVKTGMSIALRELSFRYVSKAALTVVGGGSADLVLSGNSVTGQQTGFSTAASRSLTVLSKKAAAITISNVTGGCITAPYFQANVGAERVGYIIVPFVRMEPTESARTESASFTVVNDTTSKACTAELYIPAKTRLMATSFWDDNLTLYGPVTRTAIGAYKYGLSAINVNTSMATGVTIVLSTPNFGTTGALSLTGGGSFSWGADPINSFGLEWTPRISMDNYSMCRISGTPTATGTISSNAVFCGKIITLTRGSHSFTFALRFQPGHTSSASAYSSYQS